MLRSQKFSILLCLLGFSCFSNTNAVFAANLPLSMSAIQVSAAGGVDWINTNNTNLIITAFETDSVKVRHTQYGAVWKLGVGAYFFQNVLCCHQYLNQLLLELNYYHSEATIDGDVWQYELPQFNNYSFRAPHASDRLMLDLKPTLFTWQHFSPYAILGAGFTWNKLSYRERVTGVGVDPTSFLSIGKNTTTNLAYDLGFGIKVDIQCNVSASLEYLYTYLGHASPNNTNTSLAVLSIPPKFNISTQSILLGVNWKFI